MRWMASPPCDDTLNNKVPSNVWCPEWKHIVFSNNYQVLCCQYSLWLDPPIADLDTLEKLADFTFFFPPFAHILKFTHARSHAHTHRHFLTVSLSELIYSTHIFPWSLLYVLSFLCLCLLEALRCPGLLVRGATGGYRRSGARALQLFCGSPGYRCARGQSPSGQFGLRRNQEVDPFVPERKHSWVCHFNRKCSSYCFGCFIKYNLASLRKLSTKIEPFYVWLHEFVQKIQWLIFIWDYLISSVNCGKFIF